MTDRNTQGETTPYDLVIRGGRVLDGSGNPWFRADVGIRAGRIAFVGLDRGLRASREIDAAGQIVSPGFIDMHTHSDLVPLVEPDQSAKVMQGVTTDVIGQDGLSYAPVTDQTREQFRKLLAGLNGDPPGLEWNWRTVGEYLDRFDRSIATNIAFLAPHGTIRAYVLGFENRAPGADELEAMKRLVAEAMEDGAFGLSTALTYVPCSYADTSELIELCRVVGDYGGYYAPHMRSYGARMEEAVEESIEICTKACLPLHLTHFNVSFSTGKGKVPYYLDRIDRARDEGLEVTLDMYPYLAGSTFLAGILPGWASEGGQGAAIDRLQDPETRSRIQHEMEVTGSDGMHHVPADWKNIVVSGVATEQNSRWVGATIEEIAQQQGRAPFDVFSDLLVAEKLQVSCLLRIGHEENLQRIMQHPAFMMGSDGLLVGDRPHPRAWGTFARYLHRYVRDLGILSLEECVRKMTSLPAQRLGLHDRGLIKPGMCADVVVFDPEEVRETATYENPKSHPEGIPFVVVNGVLVKDAGEPTGALPGRALRKNCSV